MFLSNFKTPYENGVCKGETLKINGMAPVIPMLNYHEPIEEKVPKNEESYDVDDLLRDYDEWDSVDVCDGVCGCEDEPWLITSPDDLRYPWEVNEMQYPWEMEKSCWESELIVEDQE